MAETVASEPYDPDNLLDRHTRRATLEHHYRHVEARERLIVDRRLGLPGGDVLSVGAGWHPGRHLFPAPAFRMVAVDTEPDRVAGVLETGRADEAFTGRAGRAGPGARSFDVVLYRLVLHHIAYQGPLARLLHRGRAPAAARRRADRHRAGRLAPGGGGARVGQRTAGWRPSCTERPTMFRCRPAGCATRRAPPGCAPELHAVTYGWRRLTPAAQRAVSRLDALGSRPRAAALGHTVDADREGRLRVGLRRLSPGAAVASLGQRVDCRHGAARAPGPTTPRRHRRPSPPRVQPRPDEPDPRASVWRLGCWSSPSSAPAGSIRRAPAPATPGRRSRSPLSGRAPWPPLPGGPAAGARRPGGGHGRTDGRCWPR